MCPYYLDGDLGRESCDSLPVIPIYFIGYCAVFKVRRRRAPLPATWGTRPSHHRRQAGLSKLNSMRAASPCTRERPTCDLPVGPVDISKNRSCPQGQPAELYKRTRATAVVRVGALNEGSLERR